MTEENKGGSVTSFHLIDGDTYRVGMCSIASGLGNPGSTTQQDYALVERVARAIIKGGKWAEADWKAWIPEAKAAISAMQPKAEG